MLDVKALGSGVVLAFLLFATNCAAQQRHVEIRFAVKHNGQTAPNPDQVTLTSGDYTTKVKMHQDRFAVPVEIAGAKSWSFSAIIIGERVQISNLSQSELAYENWTLHLAEHHYKGDYSSDFPKHAEVRSSCVLVLESEHIDPGLVISQTHCRSRR